ncbi:hypothetical protein M9978_08175 [Sphingomonas sp. MG17]|uniref:Uncharacterized protein n=1 Tax=Sphingomonas tagetis TaxID=2949092 RepID=A0A9X2HGK5_9SPHN|nr:hypothetical protein [Sphingomonas tagetis]MCP3730403.1 hypothetical protein [Sphingomonas tagetis]
MRTLEHFPAEQMRRWRELDARRPHWRRLDADELAEFDRLDHLRDLRRRRAEA